MLFMTPRVYFCVRMKIRITLNDSRTQLASTLLAVLSPVKRINTYNCTTKYKMGITIGLVNGPDVN